jgi:hypothetical protein
MQTPAAHWQWQQHVVLNEWSIGSIQALTRLPQALQGITAPSTTSSTTTTATNFPGCISIFSHAAAAFGAAAGRRPLAAATLAAAAAAAAIAAPLGAQAQCHYEGCNLLVLVQRGIILALNIKDFTSQWENGLHK